MKDGTECLHTGYSPKDAEPRVIPIVQSTTYICDPAKEMAAMFDDLMKSLIYSRFGSPTVMMARDKIAQLESGINAICIASGRATTLFFIPSICNTNNNFIGTTEIYGGSVSLFSFTLEKLDIEYIYIDRNASGEEIDKAFQPNMKAVSGKTIANLALTILDVECLAKITHRHDVPLIVNDAFTTPILYRPSEYGADIVIYSTSKYMNDHAAQVGSYIVDSENSDQVKGSFPDLTEPDESYHGVSYTKTCGKKTCIVKARIQLMRDFGVCPATRSAFLLNLGLETLAVRIKQHCESTITAVRYLEKSPCVEHVVYPGLEDYRSYPLAQKYLKGCSGVISFVVKGDKETAIRSMNTLGLTSNKVHVADVRTCVLRSASETRRQSTDEQLIAVGIESGMIRLSVGFEDTEDIITDLDKAFSAIEY